MSFQQLPLYQGRDWLTYRWTVADAFDSIDRMHDLCVGQDWETDELVSTGKEASLLPVLLDFSSDLSCFIATACADTIPPREIFGSLRHRWLCFEVSLLAQILVEQIASLIKQDQPNFEETTLILAEIKTKLSIIDV